MYCVPVLNPSAFAHYNEVNNPVLTMNYETQGIGSMVDSKGINFFINGTLITQMGGDGLYMVNSIPTFEAVTVPDGIVSGQVKNIIVRVICKDGSYLDSFFSYTIPTPIAGFYEPPPQPAAKKGRRK